jgi:tRNA1Val (adenine37-N6)-methyltransferase
MAMYSLIINKKCISLWPIMANEYFKFKQFTIWQSDCAMKVGTDGTLLGAWAEGGQKILDIGTGTGLIALMMAQRFPESYITGIDIDPAAVSQARINVAHSPFADHVEILEADAHDFNGAFDAIVSNPPFFADSLISPDSRRSIARHSLSLTYKALFETARRLLTEQGIISVVVPFDYVLKVKSEAALSGFFLHRDWAVKTTPHKNIRRFLLSFGLHSVRHIDAGVGVLEESPGQRSDWYRQLTEAFYIK